MPSKWSSSHSKSDAKDLARRLNINFNSIPIENLMTSFEESFVKTIALEMAEITNQNIQSRIRGTLLMALANQEKHLLLSTGNKSELAVGYCTLYGDMNGGLSVIGDLYKTNVFKLCNWLDSEDSINHRKSYILDQKKKFPYWKKKLKIKLGDLALLYVRIYGSIKILKVEEFIKRILFLI